MLQQWLPPSCNDFFKFWFQFSDPIQQHISQVQVSVRIVKVYEFTLAPTLRALGNQFPQCGQEIVYYFLAVDTRQLFRELAVLQDPVQGVERCAALGADADGRRARPVDLVRRAPVDAVLNSRHILLYLR